MIARFSRFLKGQSQGIYSNIWPTALCKVDRQALGGWYFDVQVGSWRVSLLSSR